MARHRRAAPGGFVYHALNRAVARLPLFQKDPDYLDSATFFDLNGKEGLNLRPEGPFLSAQGEVLGTRRQKEVRPERAIHQRL